MLAFVAIESNETRSIYYDKQVDSQENYSSLLRETNSHSFGRLLSISCVSEPGTYSELK